MFSIEIHFNEAAENAPAGDELTGTVSITAHEAGECWKVELLWDSQPKGDDRVPNASARRVNLARLVSWETGQTHSFPFRLTPGRGGGGDRRQTRWSVRVGFDMRGAHEPILTDWQAVDLKSPPTFMEMAAPAKVEPPIGAPASQFDGSPEMGVTVAGEVPSTHPTSQEMAQPVQTGAAEELGAHFQVKFSRADRKYGKGESVAGVLLVQAERDIRVRRLALGREWRTHGRTARRSGGAGEVQLAETVSWEAGKSYEYRFSFKAPDGPATIRGRNHNLDWYVWPELKFEGEAAGPAVERAARDAAEEFLIAPVGPLAVRQLAARQSQSWIVIGSAFLVSLVGILVIVALWGANQFQIDGYVGLLGFALLLAVGWSVREAYRYKLAELYLGEVRVEISNHESESSILTEIRFEPRRAVWVERMDVRLLVEEVVTVREGTRDVTRRHQLFKKPAIERLERSLRAGLQFSYQAFIEDIPENIPESGITGDEEIAWRVHVLIGIQRWLAWERSFPIRVTRS